MQRTTGGRLVLPQELSGGAKSLRRELETTNDGCQLSSEFLLETIE